MPTGYTAAIEQGISFPAFAMQCARAFGALVMMRDDAMDAEVPEEFQPATYQAEWAQEARKRLAAYEAMTMECAAEAMSIERAEQSKYRTEVIAEKHALRKKYEAMLAEVQVWEPPTPEHVELKRFMREQIRQSIDFDCDTSYYENEVIPSVSPAAWLEAKVQMERDSVARYEKCQAEEVERTNKRNAWVKALRDSLKAPA